MLEDIRQIPNRILELAKAALAQANTLSLFSDPFSAHLESLCLINAAHAGELFLKAVIAKQHPLLIFKDLFALDDGEAGVLDMSILLSKGRTYEFDALPKVLWATTGTRIRNMDCYSKVKKARNALLHFCVPENGNLQKLSIEFIYTIVDPIIFKHFKVYAIEYHDDHIGYDYLVGGLLRSQMKFSIPPDFSVSEIDLGREIEKASDEYKSWFRGELGKIGKLDLLHD
jgi:hypothetical protein